MIRLKWLLSLMLIWNITVLAQGGNLYIKITKENIRSNPNGKKIGELLSGTQVEVVERRSNWVKVNLTGWIWSNSLTPDSTRIEGYKISVKHILLETEQQANKVLGLINQGEKFEELAKQYSVDKGSRDRGGDLGEFERGDFALDEFENVAFKLKKGEISKIIKTSVGYHIIKRIQ